MNKRIICDCTGCDLNFSPMAKATLKSFCTESIFYTKGKLQEISPTVLLSRNTERESLFPSYPQTFADICFTNEGYHSPVNSGIFLKFVLKSLVG